MNLAETFTKLELNDSHIQPFQTEDPYNWNARIEGYLCTKPNDLYGALIITKVDDWECCQVIYCTPKLHYPFDKNGTFNWPPVNTIELYEKVDGTNVCAYHYMYKDMDLVSFKTRLTPVLKDQKFGMFKSMFDEYCQGNPWVRDVIAANQSYNLSFELFGTRNPITITYTVPLEVNLLFGIDRNIGSIVPPSLLVKHQNVKVPDCTTVLSWTNLDVLYNAYREKIEKENAGSLNSEGMVMYIFTNKNKWSMMKLKPETIEKIHWTASGSIPEKMLFNTAVNVFEHSNLFEDFIILLREEFKEEIINRSMHKIEKVWQNALEHAEFVTKVNEVWKQAKDAGMDIMVDKNAFMRWMSNHFDKWTMRKVAGVILKQVGLK